MAPRIKNIFFALVLMVVGTPAYAQEPPVPQRSPVPLPGLVVPIDENIIVLVALGVIYGIFITRRRKKFSKN